MSKKAKKRNEVKPVIAKCNDLFDEDGNMIVGEKNGPVVYEHPKGRYHEILVQCEGGSYRESFQGPARGAR